MSLARRIAAAEREGWTVTRRDPGRVVLRRRGTGTARRHLVVFALFGWWTLGVANALYALYEYLVNFEKRVIHRGHHRTHDHGDGGSSPSAGRRPCRQLGRLDG
jgi:hypothetical protein